MVRGKPYLQDAKNEDISLKRRSSHIWINEAYTPPEHLKHLLYMFWWAPKTVRPTNKSFTQNAEYKSHTKDVVALQIGIGKSFIHPD